MSWIRHGTISTTNGSTAVTGVDCLWSIGISPGASLYLVDGNGNPTEGPFEIAAINSNTSLTLAKPYPGVTGSARAYAIANTVGDQTIQDLANDLTKFYGEISELLDQPQVTPVANSIPVADSSGKIASGWIPDATTTAKGVVELATTAEAQAGTDATRALTPATSGSRTTFAVTSTDPATSSTTAPSKTAGGHAVAKNIISGDYIQTGKTYLLGNTVSSLAVPAGGTKRLKFTLGSPGMVAGRLVYSIYTNTAGGGDITIIGTTVAGAGLSSNVNTKVDIPAVTVSAVTLSADGFYIDFAYSGSGTLVIYFNATVTCGSSVAWTFEEVA